MSKPLVCFFSLLLFTPLLFAQGAMIRVSYSEVMVLQPGVVDADPISLPNPPYSEDAQASGRQGTAVVSFTLGGDGRPYDVALERGVDEELDRAVLDTVSNWRYEPARKKGTPVELKMKSRLSFRLYDSDHGAVAKLWDLEEAGDPNAELMLAKLYRDGAQVIPNQALSLQLLKMAADWNLPEAQFLLAEHFSTESQGDPVDAYVWYALSKRSAGRSGDNRFSELAWLKLQALAPQLTKEELGEAETRIGYWPEPPPGRF